MVGEIFVDVAIKIMMMAEMEIMKNSNNNNQNNSNSNNDNKNSKRPFITCLMCVQDRVFCCLPAVFSAS